MKLQEKLAQKMLEEKLDFLPLKESLELFDSGTEIETKFWWVCRSEELEDNGDGMTTEKLLYTLQEIYGKPVDDYYLTIGNSYDHFDGFTLALAPAPTYIDLIR